MPKHPTQIALELWRQESRAGKSVAAQLRHFADQLDQGHNIDDYLGDAIIQDTWTFTIV